MALAVVVGGITWWQTAPETRQAILSAVGHIVGWFALVLVAPWAGSLGIAWIAKKFDSNAAGAALIAGITLIEAVMLAWLLGWSISGAAAWTFFLLAVLVAAAYNLLICDWLAEKLA